MLLIPNLLARVRRVTVLIRRFHSLTRIELLHRPVQGPSKVTVNPRRFCSLTKPLNESLNRPVVLVLRVAQIIEELMLHFIERHQVWDRVSLLCERIASSGRYRHSPAEVKEPAYSPLAVEGSYGLEDVCRVHMITLIVLFRDWRFAVGWCQQTIALKNRPEVNEC